MARRRVTVGAWIITPSSALSANDTRVGGGEVGFEQDSAISLFLGVPRMIGERCGAGLAQRVSGGAVLLGR
jgi:hypothetical protein